MSQGLAIPDYEHVVLVDERNVPTGTLDKRAAHHGDTPLHRGFSVFLFDRQGRTLLQQRSVQKPTWPGVWSNACCGHPQLGESTGDAMDRRLNHELGLTGVNLEIILPDYRYRFERDGVVENEFCPVAIGLVTGEPSPNPDEVQAVRWKHWAEFLAEARNGSAYSEWCVEEALLLAEGPAFARFLEALDAVTP